MRRQELVFKIDPVAQGRPRFNGRGICYDPKKSRTFKRQIHLMAALQKCKPMQGPLSVSMTFHIRKPKRPKHNKPMGKPDLSNYIKAIEDALTGIAWIDDAQIVSVTAMKEYADQAGIYISILET